VNTGKSLFSENFPQLWLFVMGGLFIAVVMLFPNGLAGIYESVSARFARFTTARWLHACLASMSHATS
jgi:urea transport system permease protein